MGTELGNKVRQLFEEQSLTDCQFEVLDDETGESQTIGAHRMVLAIKSPVFKTMFYGDWKELATIKITDIKFEVFKKFLGSFYTNESLLITSLREAEILCYTAHKYLTTEVIDTVNSYLLDTCNKDTGFMYHDIAKMYCNEELERKCLTVFQDDIEEVVLDDGFPEEGFKDLGSSFDISLLPPDHPIIQILETQLKNIQNESHIKTKLKTALELTRCLLIYAKKTFNLTKSPSTGLESPFLSCYFEKLSQSELKTLARAFDKADTICIKCINRASNWPSEVPFYNHDGINCCFKSARTKAVLRNLIHKYQGTNLIKYDPSDIALVYRIYKSKLNYKQIIP